MMPVIRYALEEAMASLWRGRRSAPLAIVTIAVALFVLGCFLVVSVNLQQLADEWRQTAELSVFLTDEVTPSEQAAIENALAVGPIVERRTFVSKGEALTRFREMFAGVGASADIMNTNPLPASFEVRLRAAAAATDVEAFADRLRLLPGVADIRYDREWLERLLYAVSFVRRAGLALAAVLTLAAALTVTNVVRLALFARQDEIAIMQLVGAPDAYVRGPFIVEGTLQGGLGGVIALAALTAVFYAARDYYVGPAADALNLSALHFLPASTCVYLMLGGMAVGCVGGILASRSDTVRSR